MDPTYLGTIKSVLPQECTARIDSLDPSATSLLDTVLRLVSGGTCPPDAPASLRDQWSELHVKAMQSLDALKASSSTSVGKRRREEDEAEEPDAKKARSEDAEPETKAPAKVDEGHILYTLHAISVISPLRKKLDVSVHQASIRFTNPTTHATELSVPIAHLKRAFLLPTRGKAKPHWTVVIMSADRPASKASAEEPQIVFGLDALSSQSYQVTKYVKAGDSYFQKISTSPKGSATLPFLEAFLSLLPFPMLRPSVSVFRSALSTGDGCAGVEGYRGVKVGTLWFLAEGILWDGKPCEFWPLSKLVGGRSNGGNVDLGGAEGVRTVSATGRTCSVILNRKVSMKLTPEGDEIDDEDTMGSIDTDVGMVDGKEQEGIARWVKKYRHLFGVAPAADGSTQAPAPDDEDEEEDSDFEGSSSDGGSPTSSSDEEGDDEGGGDEGDDASEDLGSGSERSDDADEEEEGGEEELDPAQHPLMKPGAMPRMSRAAIDAVVGMVQDDLMGGATSLERRAANDTGESADEEEDELTMEE
ncbi:hypothetical protein EUX98_g6311 [Antrodiella citrinella]|uniref:Histone chaperone RTT106/FACT complex subunit SPT16-like middle domain-containing protein n=1 Tax=Antrodiella citrinella TaxID=2447956 RepID=A0A4S4MPE9_9APHY|nr:hypothetical protein EUX98_g6311 [Antrodiella citrinella]